MIGSLQALEAIKLLTGVAPAIADGFLQVDLATGRVPARARHAAARTARTARRSSTSRRCSVSAPCAASPASSAATSPPPTTAIPPRAASRRSRSSPPGPACRRCSPTASRTRCDETGVPLAPRMLALALALVHEHRDPPGRGDRRRPVHRPRDRRRDRRDGRGRRQRDDVPGRDARRHRLRDRQAPPDGRGQRDDRLRREAARADHDRPRREDRRELRRDPRRAAELDRRRRARPSRARRGRAAGGPGRRLGAPARSRRRRGARCSRRASPSWSGASRRPGARRRPPRSSRCATGAGRTRPAADGVRCESTVDVARPPAEVFPWLLEADKVPALDDRAARSTSRSTPGRCAVGSRIRQELTVSGQQLRFELEVARLEPPRRRDAALRGLRLQGRQRVRRHAPRAAARRRDVGDLGRHDVVQGAS